MKILLLIGLFFATIIASPQTNKSRTLKTDKYAGIYSSGDTIEGFGGMITVYPETDSTILFYIDIYTGNVGQLYARLKIENGKGVYYFKYDFDEKGCKWKVTFDSDTLTIETVDDCYECGFGANVIADNKYFRKDLTRPEYFTDGHDHKIFFSKTSPENYMN
jgi:hypothetical protein